MTTIALLLTVFVANMKSREKKMITNNCTAHIHARATPLLCTIKYVSHHIAKFIQLCVIYMRCIDAEEYR